MINQYYTKVRQFDYLDYENELLSLGRKKYLKNIFQEAESDIDLFLAKIKSLGLEIDEYSVEHHENPFLKDYEEILKTELSSEDKEKIHSHLLQVDQLNSFFVNSNNTIDGIMEEKSSQTKHLLSQFIVFLEYALRVLRSIVKKRGNEDVSLENATISFDSYISSSGVILKYLFHKIPVNNQCGYNRIFPEKDLLWNNHVYENYVERDNLMDAFEYWKYSKIKIIEQIDKPLIDFVDEEFNKAVLVGNFRHKNFMRDIELDITNYIKNRGIINSEDSFDKIRIDHVSNELCRRYFGKENMNNTIYGVELKKWIESIHFFKYESINFLEKRKENIIFSVRNLCIVRTEFEWKKRLVNFSRNLSDEEAKIIINKLIFCRRSKDLIDAPLIKIQDKLILLPTLTREIRPLSAILSMFSREEDKGVDFSFKGKVFEDRIKHLLKASNNITSQRLHVRLDEIDFEREIDVAFVLDNQLFLIECKSFNQPYTVREHSKTNKKIKDAVDQLNKNANYFEENLDIVKKQLGLKEDFEINEMHRVLLTSTTLGEAGQQANILLTDEASLNGFLLRNSPNLTLLDGNKKTTFCVDNQGVYSGKVTAHKMLAFLKCQPMIERMKKRVNKVLDSEGIISYCCCKKTIEDIYVKKTATESGFSGS